MRANGLGSNWKAAQQQLEAARKELELSFAPSPVVSVAGTGQKGEAGAPGRSWVGTISAGPRQVRAASH